MAKSLFVQKAPGLVASLLSDLPLRGDEESAAAIVGNLGHESAGFASLQEIKPSVSGSRGGYGWAQWTGARRTAYEAWCKKQKLSPASDEANYGYLLVELRGPYKAAISKMSAKTSLDEKVIAFEMAFERAGIKHYPERIALAKQALKLYWAANAKPSTASKPIAVPDGSEIVKTSSVTPEQAQQALKDLGYDPGIIGGDAGTPGGRTTGAIAAFRLDRGIGGAAVIDDALISELGKAKVEGWTRPIAKARAEATVATVAEKAPEVKSAWKTKILAMVTTIGAAGSGLVSGIADYFDAAKGYVDPVKEFFGDIPPLGWLALAAAIAGVLWYHSQKSETRGVEAYRSGERA